MEDLAKLVEVLCALPDEQQWFEFKYDNYKPEMIGSDISALANSATLHEKEYAYMIWGIDDTTHEIIGTNNNLQSLKIGNQELENWLRSLLSDNAVFSFHTVSVQNKNIGVLVIGCAQGHPITFKSIPYVRLGSYTKKLQDHPSLQAALWEKLRFTPLQ